MLADIPLPRFVRRRIGLPYARQADRARLRADWIEAILGYRRALEWMPWRHDLRIQIGNCLKEFGDHRGAIVAYRSVTDGASRPEAAKQMADANARAGLRVLPYDISDVANPRQDAPAREIPAASVATLPNRIKIEEIETRRWLGTLGQRDDRSVRAKMSSHTSIVLDQVGAMSIERDGALEPLLDGVVAVRARVVCTSRLESVRIRIGADQIDTVTLEAKATSVDQHFKLLKLNIVNAWIDASRLPPGRHWLEVDAGKGIPTAGLFVNVAVPGTVAADLAGSDAYVALGDAAIDDVDAAVIALPAEVRSASRSLFDRPIRRIVAMRVDQLGDVAATLPALAQLRSLFPGADLTVVVQPNIRGIVAACGIADRVEGLELSYHHESERRHLAIAEEERIRALFRDDGIDLAIDLNPGDETRPILLLTHATYMVGFNPDRFTFLDWGIGIRSRDKVNQIGNQSHAATVMTLVAGLEVATISKRPAVARAAPSLAQLAAQELTAGRYVVLHTGARHPLNCWPIEKFARLAESILRETDLVVVVFTDPTVTWGATAPGDGRLMLLSHTDPDAFDAILSNAALVVGNDSGPKHLAAVRGVPTVSIHVGRLNWNEWGQDSCGEIVSKRVPCVGCGLNDIDLCGRDAICIRAITVDEVMAPVRRALGG